MNMTKVVDSQRDDEVMVILKACVVDFGIWICKLWNVSQ